MADPVALALALSQAGPVAIVLVGIILLVVGFTRGGVVPGYIYKAEQLQRAKSEAQAERATESVVALTATVQKALDVLLLRDSGH